MSKKKRKQKKKNRQGSSFIGGESWLEEDGIHAIAAGIPPTPEMLEQMTKVYQQKIRNSPLWDKMVEEFGLEEAKRLLKEFRAEGR
ncbi:hypothetical protein ES703_91326 [subsurface metagenome]